MTDRTMAGLLKPDEVREQFAFQDIMRLREDYLTLWDAMKGLAEEFENIQWKENGALKARVKELETTIGWYEEKHPND